MKIKYNYLIDTTTKAIKEYISDVLAMFDFKDKKHL